MELDFSDIICSTIRESDDELYIETRFADGEKFSAITIDKKLKSSGKLANFINDTINKKGSGMKPCTIIFDIDGTLANSKERAEKFLSGDVKDWDSFYDDCENDDAIQPTCGLCSLLNGSYRIIYLTGRPEKTRMQTAKWLVKNNLPNGLVYMRRNEDHRPDYEFKKEIYEKEIAPYNNVVAVFEDRQQCVDMWRELGITCYQVSKGDY